MDASLRVLIPAAALLTSTALPGFAADYEPPIVIDQPVEEVPVEIGSGWYLRGDIGYNFTTESDGGISFRAFDPATGSYNPDSFDTVSLGSSMTFGGGVGYNFTDYFRADFTVDGFRLPFDGTTSSPTPCLPGAAYAGTGCRSEDSATASAISLMLNGYVDLGTYVGFTPYVGGGLGYTYVDWSGLSSNIYCTGVTCPTGIAAYSESGGQQSWRFTYAAMAGLAYDLTNNLKVDVGYRYRYIDSGAMFSFDPATQAAGASGVQADDSGFTTHEVRVGLRYALW